MTSEIRTNTLKNRVGLGTISLTSTGPVVSGITTLKDDVEFHGTSDSNTIKFDKSDNSLKFTDGAKAKFGISSDLEVYHDGSHSHIREIGTGDLRLRSSKIQLMNENSQEYFVGNSGGSVELYHNNTKRLETFDNNPFVGVSVTNDVVLNGAGDTAYRWAVGGNASSNFKWSMYYSNSDGALRLFDNVNSRTVSVWKNNGAIELNYGSGKKFETTSSGATVTGTLISDGLTLYDNEKILFGNNNDLEIFHNGTDNIIQSDIGDLQINSGNSAGDVVINVNNNVAGNTRETSAKFINNGGVELYHNSNLKLSTTSTGISITGIPVATQSTGNIGLELHATGSGRGSQTKYHNDHGVQYVGTAGDTTGNLLIWQESNANIFFATNNTQRLRIDNNGRLIAGGTSAGTYHQDGDEFNIYSTGNTGMSIFSGTSSLGSLFFADDNNDVHGQRRGAIQYNHDGNSLAFWTNASERLSIASDGHVTISANSYSALTINTTNNGANGPEVQLMHTSTSPAAGDVVGQLRYSGKDSAGNTRLYGKIESKIDDPTNGQATGHLEFSTRGYNSYNSIFRLKNRGTASAPSYTTDDMNGIILDVYNTGNPYPRYMNFIAKGGGNTDSNITFWTEEVGGSPTEKLRITSGGKVSLGYPMTTPPAWLHVKGNTYQTLRLENFDGGANGPYIELYNNSSSPVNNDYTGIISFKNRNSAAEEITYTQIRSQSTDVADGTEDGVLTFHTRHNGTFGERLRIKSNGEMQLKDSTIRYENTGGNFNQVRHLQFPIYFSSGVTHTVLTIGGALDAGFVAFATLEYIGLYSYAGTAMSGGVRRAYTRRTYNNTQWRDFDNQVSENYGENYRPDIKWENGVLKVTVGGSVQITGYITVTAHANNMSNFSLTRN